MVDPDVVIDGLTGPGELLTLTTDEAQQWGYADGVVTSREDLLTAAGLSGLTLKATAPSLAEQVVRFITDPAVASLMIAAAILLIIGDLLVGGFGIIAGIGLLLLGLFFWGHNLAGLAGWEDIALVLLGLALLGIEVFVVPGFGVPGILGLAAMAGGFWLAMVGGGVRAAQASERAGWSVAGQYRHSGWCDSTALVSPQRPPARRSGAAGARRCRRSSRAQTSRLAHLVWRRTGA